MSFRFRLAAAAAALLLLSVGPASAAPLAAVKRYPPGALKLLPVPASACAQGLAYDDGSFEGHPSVGEVGTLDAVMAFDLPAVPSGLDKVCVCWTRTGGAEEAGFDLLIYDDDGFAHQPGSLLAGLGGLTAESVPLFPQVAFYELDLAALGISLASERVYIGPSWDTQARPDLHACGDESGSVPRPVLYSTDLGASWNDLGGLFPGLTALGVRAELETGGEPSDCVADDTTLCLNDGRFRVRVSWRTGAGNQGPGHAVPFGSDDSGLLWFFNPSNWEMLIKVLDGCPVNERYWVFFAAVTNVEFTLTVTDTTSGVTRIYLNPLGQSADSVTDTGAFDACP